MEYIKINRTIHTTRMEVQIFCYIVHFATYSKPDIFDFIMFGQFLVTNWSDDAFCTS